MMNHYFICAVPNVSRCTYYFWCKVWQRLKGNDGKIINILLLKVGEIFVMICIKILRINLCTKTESGLNHGPYCAATVCTPTQIRTEACPGEKENIDRLQLHLVECYAFGFATCQRLSVILN